MQARRMKNLFLYLFIFIGTAIFSGCVPYYVGDRQFFSSDDALIYQSQICDMQLSGIVPKHYFGGSLLICKPPNNILLSPPFTTTQVGTVLSLLQKQFFLDFYTCDFDYMKLAFKKSHMFESVNIEQTSSYLTYAKENCYSYLFTNNGDGTCTIFDLQLGKDKTIKNSGGLVNIINNTEDAILNFKKENTPTNISTNAVEEHKEELSYDDKTGKGKISISGQGLSARPYLLKRIAEICSSKHVLLKADEKVPAGSYKILDEELSNGKLTIEFEATY